MKLVTLDCETLRTFPPKDKAWETPEVFGLAVLGMHVDTDGNKKDGWWTPDKNAINLCRDDRYMSADEVQHHLSSADCVISFNGERFDFKVLSGAGFDMTHAREVSYDLMAKFVQVTGHRISLANLSKSLGVGEKSGEGVLAVQLWQAAEQLLITPDRVQLINGKSIKPEYAAVCEAGAKHLYNAVIDYCLDDVKITRACYDTLIHESGQMQYWSLKDKAYRDIRLELPEIFSRG